MKIKCLRENVKNKNNELTMAFNKERSLSGTNVTAYPSRPARAVRPTR